MNNDSLAAQLIGRNFDVQSGVLVIDRCTVTDLTEQFGTPLFVYSATVMERAWQDLRDNYPEKFDLLYSVKANPNQTLLKRFLNLGTGLEVASGGELHQAISAGCDSRRILFAGPGKTDTELSEAVDLGIGEIHIESMNEAHRLSRIAEHKGVSVRVAIRVNPAAESAGGAMRMGGQPTQFGIDEEVLTDHVKAIDNLNNLELSGLHFFLGTQILDAEVLLRQYRHCLSVAQQMAELRKQPFESIDFGGGLGIPYFSGDTPMGLPTLRSGLDALVQDYSRDPLFETTRFLLEPGRYLMGEAGVYLTRIVDIKTSRNTRFAITDGGMNHHLAASGNLGQVIKRNFPVLVANKTEAAEAGMVNLVGPLCTPLDIVAQKIHCPELEPGDIIAVLQSGAYARAASPLGFLSHNTPAEILVDNGAAALIRRRGTPDDWLTDQLPG